MDISSVYVSKEALYVVGEPFSEKHDSSVLVKSMH